MTFPKVSIVIPVMNGENFLQEAILSCLNQDYPNFEVLIGINPSSDLTEKIAESFKDDSRIVVFKFQEKVNMPANFNRTGLNATGEYIKFLCHDDILPSNSVSELVKEFIKSDRNVFAVGYESFIKSDRKIRGPESFGLNNFISGKTVLRRVIRYNNWIGGPSLALIESSLFFERPFDETLECAFDLDYWVYLATKGRMAVSKEIVLYSRVHEYQATNKCLEGGFVKDIQLINSRMRRKYKIGRINSIFLSTRNIMDKL